MAVVLILIGQHTCGSDKMKIAMFLKYTTILFAAFFSISFSTSGCSDDSSTSECEPGSEQDCSCADGTTGRQQCLDDKVWGSCQCAEDGGVDANDGQSSDGDAAYDAGADQGSDEGADNGTDAGADSAADAGTDAGADDSDPGHEVFEEIGSTSDVGFISLGEFNGKLYAGTYNPGTVHVYSYPPWKEEAALDAGESVYDLEAFSGKLYAITENRNKLFASADGSNFAVVFTEPENNLGLGVFTKNNALFATFTRFSGATKGPSLWKTTDGATFTELNASSWPPVGDPARIVYEGKPELDGRVYKNAYTTNYTQTNIYSSQTGDNWSLVQSYNGIKSYLISYDDKIYGLRDGNIIVEYDGSDERDVATGPVAGFHAIGAYRGYLYLLTSTDCWNNCEAAGQGSELYRYDFADGTFTKIRKFDNQAGVKLRVFDDALIIATKSGRLDAGRRGKLYRMTFSK